ncbi:STAS domain-containing protein [Streptomyces liliiviolaceus]|uniref:STAS domain-containing protein n=1 Tax=Streptomyces liliiviolaceus TaxID=2823109 RepID=UPI0027E22F74|nr:STAS domain-containing protein [Streptomyces liliiviolaceus]
MRRGKGEDVVADPSVETAVSGRCLVARVSGGMDHASDPALRAQLRQLIVQGNRFIVLDLSRVSFCDSSGLNMLLGVWRQANAVASVVVLACVPDRLRRILQITGADQVLRVYDTVTDAQAGLNT